MEYYESKLMQHEIPIYHKVVEAIKEHKQSVNLGFGITQDSLYKIVEAIRYDFPALFYVNFNQILFSKSVWGIAYNISYLYPANAVCQMENSIEKTISQIISKVNSSQSSSIYAKCKLLHNYFAKKVNYNYQALADPFANPDAFNIVGVFLQKKAVCEGISKAYKILCDRLGIDCLIIHGQSLHYSTKQNIEHAWNIVKLPAGFVHVDVTWDLGISQNLKMYCYDYFFVSDKEIRQDHQYCSYPQCELESSYFDVTKRKMTSLSQLERFVEKKAIERKAIYFKIGQNSLLDRYKKSDIQSLVGKIISNTLKTGITFQLSVNETQKVFCFIIHTV